MWKTENRVGRWTEHGHVVCGGRDGVVCGGRSTGMWWTKKTRTNIYNMSLEGHYKGVA